tara:strand:- start:364 stop:1020 length:657 start_codon:yes stop_codon:yes gene_type:complete
MATKTLILSVIRSIVRFLGNPDRPETVDLPVTDLATFGRSKKRVPYSRKVVRAFAKAVLLERQGFNEGLKALEGKNIKSLKDLQLAELLGLTTAKPSGENLSKFYTTIRRMVKTKIMAAAIEDASETKATKPKASKKSKARKAKPAAKKPKASKKKAEPKDTVVSFAGVAPVTIPTTEWKKNRAHWAQRAKAVGLVVGGEMSKKEIIVRTIAFEAMFG